MKNPKMTVCAKVDLPELAAAAQMFEAAGFRIGSKSDLVCECVRQMAILAGKSTRYMIIVPDTNEYALRILKSLGYDFESNKKARREVKRLLEKEDISMEYSPGEAEMGYVLREALMTRAKQQARERASEGASEDADEDVLRPTPTAATPEELAAFATRSMHRVSGSEEPTDADDEAFLAKKRTQDSALFNGLGQRPREVSDEKE